MGLKYIIMQNKKQLVVQTFNIVLSLLRALSPGTFAPVRFGRRCPRSVCNQVFSHRYVTPVRYSHGHSYLDMSDLDVSDHHVSHLDNSVPGVLKSDVLDLEALDPYILHLDISDPSFLNLVVSHS